MNTDALNHVSTVDVTRAMMAMLNAVQDMDAHIQAPAMAALFTLACERHGLKPQDVFTVTNNIMNHAEGRRPEFEGVAAYLANEL